MSEMTNTTRKRKKRIFATEAAPVAIPPKPNTPAMRAITKNSKASRSTSAFLSAAQGYSAVVYYKVGRAGQSPYGQKDEFSVRLWLRWT